MARQKQDPFTVLPPLGTYKRALLCKLLSPEGITVAEMIELGLAKGRTQAYSMIVNFREVNGWRIKASTAFGKRRGTAAKPRAIYRVTGRYNEDGSLAYALKAPSDRPSTNNSIPNSAINNIELHKEFD